MLVFCLHCIQNITLRYLKDYPQREDLLKLLTGFEKFKEKIPMRNSIVMLIICFSVVLVCNVIEAKLLMLILKVEKLMTTFGEKREV